MHNAENVFEHALMALVLTRGIRTQFHAGISSWNSLNILNRLQLVIILESILFHF